MTLPIPPSGLENELIHLTSLQARDFENLYQVARDPLIWEQHPQKNRCERPVFEEFFAKALESNGALLVWDRRLDSVIGSSRYYDFESSSRQVKIGYTFLDRRYWGTGTNRSLKNLMLDHAFQYADTAIFEIAAGNIRSQKAIEKLGAEKTGMGHTDVSGLPPVPFFVYEISKAAWTRQFQPSSIGH